MSPDQYVKERAAKSGSSFYTAFRFLPPNRRDALTAFYAFCREVDDVVDEVSDPAVAAAKLGWWRTEVAKAFQGTPTHPAMKALLPHTKAFDIRAEHLLAVIDGCDMDLQQNRFLDFKALEKYCHLVAGVVGEVASNIFGRTQPQTTAFAHRLGLAAPHRPAILGSPRCVDVPAAACGAGHRGVRQTRQSAPKAGPRAWR
jgi:phytoene synthase